jgi:hypothetical protein
LGYTLVGRDYKKGLKMKDSTNIVLNQIHGQSYGFPLDKIFPDILWILFWLLLVILMRKYLEDIINYLLIRLKQGAGIKIGSVEIQGLKVSGGNGVKNNHFELSFDNTRQRESERTNFYKRHRGVMPVHKIYKSQKNGQLYDILIYMIPHKDSNLIQITSVDYFFGKMWDNKIFTTRNRSNGFAIATSAYAPFLCSAKINFNDGNSETVFRYIEFEMGDVALIINDEEK